MASSHSCKICSTDSGSYVFRKVAEKATHTVFYTCPSKVKTEFSPDEIIHHYRHRLQENGAKKWLWIFDGANFDTDHIMELKTGEGIAELMDTAHGKLLIEIKMINPTVHLKVLLKVIKPFMKDEVIAKINLLDQRSHSVLEFM